MFADTLTITINAVAKVLNRINQDGYSSEYFLRTSVDEYRLAIRNTTVTNKARGKTVYRHAFEFIHTIYPVAPATVPTVRKIYTVLENDDFDVTVDISKFAAGFVGFTTEANFTKVINLES